MIRELIRLLRVFQDVLSNIENLELSDREAEMFRELLEIYDQIKKIVVQVYGKDLEWIAFRFRFC